MDKVAKHKELLNYNGIELKYSFAACQSLMTKVRFKQS